MSNTLQNTFSMVILNTNHKFVHIFNLLRSFPKPMFYYLCEENAIISEIFGFININIQKLLLMKGQFINIDLLQQFDIENYQNTDRNCFIKI